MKSGNLNFLEPSGPPQACNGTALPFTSLMNGVTMKIVHSKLELRFYTTAQEYESSTHILYSWSHVVCHLLDVSFRMDILHVCCVEVRRVVAAWK